MAGAIATGVIAVLHAVVMGTSHWSEWAAGALRDGTAGADAWASFWAQPGGFEPALIAVAILLASMARRGHTPPVSVGIVLVAWVVLCIGLIGPFSGFSLALVPTGLVLAAGIRGRLATAVVTPPEPVRPGEALQHSSLC